MGIERFFIALSKKFNIVKNFKETNYDDILDAKYIYMDFNSVIHNISSGLLKELNLNNTIMEFSELNELIIKHVNEYLINFLKRFDAEKISLLYIALDGYPTFAKIIEQKKRRYVGELLEYITNYYNNNNILPNLWGKNNISPGTIFMDKMNDFLLNFKYKNINIEISTTDEKGEAEMKILDLINLLSLNNSDRVIFFSPDADVILLSMISTNFKNIDIIKYDNNKLLYSIIDITLLTQSIYDFCIGRLEKTAINELNLKKLMHDIVFIFTMFGNDFLPRCESIQTNLDIIFIIDIYLINYIDINSYILDKSTINYKVLYNYFKLLSKHEKRLLFRNAFMNMYLNYNNNNQKNFIIDLYNIKNFKNNFNNPIFGQPFNNLYDNILNFVEPQKLKFDDNKYGCLNFYLINKIKLIDLIKDYIQENEDLPLNSLITKKLNRDSLPKYEKVHPINYTSNLPKHIEMMKNMSDTEKTQYMMDNKLDKYFEIFYPVNSFLKHCIKSKHIDHNYYYLKYFNNNSLKKIVKEYLVGLEWIHEYYFSRKNLNELWYYPYSKVPLFDSIITYFTPHNIINKATLDITPYQHLLYVIPIDIDNLDKLKTLFPEKCLGEVKNFIKKNPTYFYNINKIYKSNNYNNLLDCSQSVFLNKCHLHMLDTVIDINLFKNDKF